MASFIPALLRYNMCIGFVSVYSSIPRNEPTNGLQRLRCFPLVVTATVLNEFLQLLLFSTLAPFIALLDPVVFLNAIGGSWNICFRSQRKGRRRHLPRRHVSAFKSHSFSTVFTGSAMGCFSSSFGWGCSFSTSFSSELGE